jgi:hypothetical protein
LLTLPPFRSILESGGKLTDGAGIAADTGRSSPAQRVSPALWTLSPPPGSFVERRKAHRRSGVGRRIQGERRAELQAPTPLAIPADWILRRRQRRSSKRRVLADRRRSSAPVL